MVSGESIGRIMKKFNIEPHNKKQIIEEIDKRMLATRISVDRQITYNQGINMVRNELKEILKFALGSKKFNDSYSGADE